MDALHGNRAVLRQPVHQDASNVEAKVPLVEYDGIIKSGLEFSPNGERVAFAAKRDGKWVINVNGAEWNAHDGIVAMRFSPDSKHLAYVIGSAGQQVVAVDGVLGKRYGVMLRGSNLRRAQG